MVLDDLHWLRREVNSYYPQNAPPIRTRLTKNGHVLLEWDLVNNHVSLSVNLQSKTGVWHRYDRRAKNDDTRELDLTIPNSWKWAFGRVIRYARYVQSMSISHNGPILLNKPCGTCGGKLEVDMRNLDSNPQCLQCARYDYTIQVGVGGLVYNVTVDTEYEDEEENEEC